MGYQDDQVVAVGHDDRRVELDRVDYVVVVLAYVAAAVVHVVALTGL